jgi:hypothetical protein
MSNHKLFLNWHNKAAQEMVTVYKGAGRIYRRIGITVWKMFVINNFF